MLLGTLVNVATVLLGTAMGLFLRKSIPQRLRDTVMQGLGLCVLLIGLSSAIKTNDMMCVIISMVAGGLLGSAIDIERRLNSLGETIERRAGSRAEHGSLSAGFVTASLTFCVGAMTIVGSLDSGLRGDHATLLAKAVLDGVASIFFASALGAGVGLAALTILIYQGALTLLAGVVAPFLTDALVTEMSAVGGLLILGIGLNMLRDRKIPVGNLLPAMFIPIAYLPVSQLFK